MEDSMQEKQPCCILEFQPDEDLTDSCEQIESVHTKLHETIIPRVDMEFETEDSAYEFYNSYALAAGFSVRKGNCHREKGLVLDRTFLCSSEGKRGKDKRDDVYKSHQAETRFGCLAKLKIRCLQYGKYRVTVFNPKHNHTLSSPRKTHLFRSHRKVTRPQASEVDIADMSGIPPKSTFEFMARQAGGHKHLGFSHIDIKNYLRTKRSSTIKSGDTGGVLEYMQRMREEDPSFFYAIQVDEDDLVSNIFWADATMISDYEDFGDVVCFDTTYRKHKDGRPVALFVGVNHHRQTTIFGVALLYYETADSFVWLFDTFYRAMGEKLPKTILTDQDAAMAKALASQWPDTNHRLCIWHMFQNAATRLSHVLSRDKGFSKDLSNCVYNYEHEWEFLDAWNNMLEKYELQDNDWMKRMFSIREKWALVYGKDTFSADMTTTQRSESTNAMIKHYVSYKDNLRRFFDNFQRLLDDRRYDEMVADFRTCQSKVALAFPVQILKHAASVYTAMVYKLFSESLCEAFDCEHRVSCETDSLMKYLITPFNKHHSFVVSCNKLEQTICCNCRHFEFAGLLCSHVLKVLIQQGVKAILEKATEFEEGYNTVKEGLVYLFRDLDLKFSKRIEQPSIDSNQVEEDDGSPDMPIDATGVETTVRGIKVKPKSSSRSARPKSSVEKATRKYRKSQHKKTHMEQHRFPINPSLGNQIAEVPASTMNFTSLSTQPNLQFLTQEYAQLSKD